MGGIETKYPHLKFSLLNYVIKDLSVEVGLKLFSWAIIDPEDSSPVTKDLIIKVGLRRQNFADFCTVEIRVTKDLIIKVGLRRQGSSLIHVNIFG